MKRLSQFSKSFYQLLALAGLASSVAAGCAGGEEAPSSSLQEAEQDVSSSGVNATLSFQQDWGNGYCATVTIANVGTTNVTGWQVGVNLQQSRMKQIWNGKAAVNGSSMTTTAWPGCWPHAPG